jgi:hypothetical protein
LQQLLIGITGVLSFGIAFMLLQFEAIVCSPDSFHQIHWHAIWHIISGLAIGFVFFFHLSDNFAMILQKQWQHDEEDHEGGRRKTKFQIKLSQIKKTMGSSKKKSSFVMSDSEKLRLEMIKSNSVRQTDQSNSSGSEELDLNNLYPVGRDVDDDDDGNNVNNHDKNDYHGDREKSQYDLSLGKITSIMTGNSMHSIQEVKIGQLEEASSFSSNDRSSPRFNNHVDKFERFEDNL